MDVKSTDSYQSWFCVLNSPEKLYGDLTPRQIVLRVIEDWMKEHPNGSCGANYEKGDTGNNHIHAVFEDPAKVRFSNIRKLYPGIHCEPTRGTKKQAMAYLQKKPPFDEKSHTVIVPAIIQGNITSNRTSEKERVYSAIDNMIAEGMTPNEIMALGCRYRKEEGIIRGAYFAYRASQLPPMRKVETEYHVGLSGTGKSYTYVKLCEEYGSDNIYVTADMSKMGAFDLYGGEPVIFLDEMRYMEYAMLLTVLGSLKGQIHCRYKNAVMLWERVVITSILPPEILYEEIVPPYKRQHDSYEQLRRRITNVVFHYIDDKGEYRTYTMPGNEYKDYKDLRDKALGKKDETGFVSVEKLPRCEQMTIPFDE